MPEQFVNPAPNQKLEKYFSFDFPCGIDGENVEAPPVAAGQQGYCPFVTVAPPAYGNVNLRAPVTESLYGKLGNPRKEQGHPFIREIRPEGEDPAAPDLDQTVDIDRGFFVDHTGRLSGNFVELLASKPHLSVVVATAIPMSPVGPHSVSIPLGRFVNWLEPKSEGPNVWYWRVPTNKTELLYTAHVVIPDPQNIEVDGKTYSLQAETVYKLTFQWRFYKWLGAGAPPKAAPDPAKEPRIVQRLGISGYDEAMSFEMIQGTHGP